MFLSLADGAVLPVGNSVEPACCTSFSLLMTVTSLHTVMALRARARQCTLQEEHGASGRGRCRLRAR